MHVSVFRGDVEVSGQNQLRVLGQLFAKPGFQRRQPGQFVRIFLAADRLPVRNVGADDADAIYCCSDQAFLRIRKMWVAVGDIGRRLTRQQGDAVVGFLPGENNLIASRLNRLLREVVVFELCFLQANNIRLLRRKPFKQLR